MRLHDRLARDNSRALTIQDHGQDQGRRRRNNSGFALLELTIAMIVLAIGMVSMLQAGSRTQSLSRENRERAVAHNALRSVADRILSRSDQLVRLDPDSWSRNMVTTYGAGGTVGTDFDVLGLNAPTDGEMVGSIAIIVDETTTDAALELRLGMPRDLDGDGVATSVDVTDFARKLPVVIEVRWRGFRGVRSLRHVLWVTGI